MDCINYWNGTWPQDITTGNDVEPIYKEGDVEMKRFRRANNQNDEREIEEWFESNDDFRKANDDRPPEFSLFLIYAQSLSVSHPVEYICLLMDGMRYCPGEKEQMYSNLSDSYCFGARRFELSLFIWKEISRLWPSSSKERGSSVPSLLDLNVEKIIQNIETNITTSQSVLPELLKVKKAVKGIPDTLVGLVISNFVADLFVKLSQDPSDLSSLCKLTKELGFVIPTIKLLNHAVQVGDPRCDFVESNIRNGTELLELIIESGTIKFLDNAIASCISVSRYENMRIQFTTLLETKGYYVHALKAGIFCPKDYDITKLIKEKNINDEQLKSVVSFYQNSNPWWSSGSGSMCHPQLKRFSKILNAHGLKEEAQVLTNFKTHE